MKVTPIDKITIGENVYDVAELSESIQQMVELFNEWRQDEAGVKSELAKVQNAINSLSRTIVAEIQKENAPAEDGTEVPDTDGPVASEEAAE